MAVFFSLDSFNRVWLFHHYNESCCHHKHTHRTHSAPHAYTAYEQCISFSSCTSDKNAYQNISILYEIGSFALVRAEQVLPLCYVHFTQFLGFHIRLESWFCSWLVTRYDHMLPHYFYSSSGFFSWEFWIDEIEERTCIDDFYIFYLVLFFTMGLQRVTFKSQLFC